MIKRKNPARGGRVWLKLLLALAVLAAMGLIYLDAKVRYSFDEKQYQLPARVYARSLVLEPGKRLHAEDLKAELTRLGYAPSARWRVPGRYWQRGDHFSIATRGYRSLGGRIPPLRFTITVRNGVVVALQDAGGNQLNKVRLEPLEIGSIYPGHREDRVLAKLESVPQSLIDILLLIEDRHFYEHHGLSPKSIARALLANIKAGRTVQGGSTLTQQLVKNIFLSADRSLWRKGLEAIMALMVELHYSKPDILQSYINEVYLGQEGPRAIHGFALASRHYFNRPLEDLDASQIAMLVGLVKGPSYYDPWRYPARALKRRNTVLTVMAEQQLITESERQRLAAEGLSLAKNSALDSVFPAYLDLVRRQLRRDYSEEDLQTEGMNIYTAFDPIVQRHAERAMASVLSGQDEALQGAMVVTDVRNGNVVAVVGGRQMRFAGFNRALDAVRAVGSLIKPAVYLTALQDPRHYTLATPVSDGPVEVAGADGSIWQPQNFDHRDHGDVPLHTALANSYNQATARLGMQLGLDKVLDTVQHLGIRRPLPELPSMLLGAAELSPLEVTAMYQTIAASGVLSPLRSIIDIADSNGVAMAQYPLDQYQAVGKATMHLLHYALIEVVHEGTGKSVYKTLPADFQVAGKTGTSDDLRDSWFAGFSGDYLAVVWLGRDDNTATGLTGAAGALRVWSTFMARASHVPLKFAVPDGIAYHWIDSETGLLSREICQNARYMPFIQGSAPRQRADCSANLPRVWDWFKNLF